MGSFGSPFFAEKNILKYRYLFYISLAVITYLAFTPLAVPTPPGQFGDKINHIGAFFALSFLGYMGHKQSFFKLAALLFLYGVFIEVVQHFLPNRYLSGYDIFADALGIVAFYILNKFKIYFI